MVPTVLSAPTRSLGNAQFFSRSRSPFDLDETLKSVDLPKVSGSSGAREAAQPESDSGYLPEFDQLVADSPIINYQEQLFDCDIAWGISWLRFGGTSHPDLIQIDGIDPN
ncbi:hypothetical protein F5B22DRAFT_651339 [Xylaria bambusicola]|uniref:uncharacterized protein n=1 Tax=Xylaria bambusicola TaxID=326684 RepID=UPI002008A0FF|nr:uncharacterized protein F5B22DRAFT_651339 [Xylaria bambusicola]KAI0505790.1 hypothetical protein F5B22DRAFT_651339 [Xylaria bambusicola]